MPEPVRSISAVVASRRAFERNVIEEASAHACGYPPGLEMWDACPSGRMGVVAATTVDPEAVTHSESNAEPAPLASGHSLRYCFAQTISVLDAMLLALLAAVLGSPKSRNVH